MNLVGTLAKVAMGAMVARGVGKMMGGNRGGGGGGLGGMLGGMLGGGQQQQQQGGGGLGGLLGGALGGGQQQQGGGGLGGLLGGALGGGQQQAGGGGLGGMLGGLLSGGQQGGGAAGGGLGGLLDSLGGGQQQGGGGLGGMLNQALGGQQTQQPTADQNTAAEIMLRGMINAAKSDGEIDQQEQEKILEHLGDVTQEEIDFVKNEFQQPLDLQGFIRSVPQGSEQQVYLMSLLGIDLDSQAEAQYLDQLAKGMGISQEQANQIHAQLGVPSLYG